MLEEHSAVGTWGITAALQMCVLRAAALHWQLLQHGVLQEIVTLQHWMPAEHELVPQEGTTAHKSSSWVVRSAQSSSFQTKTKYFLPVP